MCLILVFTGSSIIRVSLTNNQIKLIFCSFSDHKEVTPWNTSSLKLVDNSGHSQPGSLLLQVRQILPYPLKQRRKINQPPDPGHLPSSRNPG